MLPCAHDAPAGIGEPSIYRTIPGHVPVQLSPPVVAVRPRHVAVLRTAMPEAPVHKHRQSRTGENDIGSNRPIGEPQREVLSEAQAETVKLGTERDLGLCVSPRVRAHAPRYGLARRVWIGQPH